MAIHQPHPKCPQCGRALYKAYGKGSKVSPEDPYVFCRNAACDLGGEEGIERRGSRARCAVGHGAADGCAECDPAVQVDMDREAAAPPPTSETPPAAPETPALVPEPEPRTPEPTRPFRRRSAPASVSSEDAPRTVAVIVARQKIKHVIAALTADKSREAVGLILALVNQELGCHAGANALIDELGLDVKFGLEKFTD